MLRPNSGAADSAARGATHGDAPLLSRRLVLAGGGRGLLALALVGTAAACGPGGPPTPDPLEAQLNAARRDAELAAAAATAAAPWMVPALNVIADERTRHAAALVEELARAAGKPTPTAATETTAVTSASPAGPGASPAPAPTVQDVATALRKSAGSAADLVPTLSGYRAGLMGSIAAACTASYTVGLTPPRTPPGRPR